MNLNILAYTLCFEKEIRTKAIFLGTTKKSAIFICRNQYNINVLCKAYEIVQVKIKRMHLKSLTH